MKILITGGRGFVGRHLAGLLGSAGHEVVTLDVGKSLGAQEGESPKPDPGGASRPGAGTAPEPRPAEVAGPDVGGAPAKETYYECDIRDFNRLSELVRQVDPDAVAHLAAWSSAGLSFKKPTEAFEVNTQGTVNLLEAVKDTRITTRTLVVSSCEVYSASGSEGPLREDSPVGPVNPYGLGKACAEFVSFYYQSIWGLDITLVRPFNHTGPGQTDTFVLPSFARQVAEAEKGLREPKLSVGNLGVVRDFTDVRDVVGAYRILLERRPPGEIYNVCSGRGYLLKELVEKLISFSTVKMEVEIDKERLRKAETPAFVGDNGRITQDLGWRPQIPMEKTLADLLEYWRAKVPS